jgi:DNA-directed RNA polymerase specialized sigma subunit
MCPRISTSAPGLRTTRLKTARSSNCTLKKLEVFSSDAEPFEAALTTDEHGRQCWALRRLEDSTFEHVCALLKDGLTQKDIADELGLAKSAVSHHAKRACAEGGVLDGR